ncbi:MAG: acetyl-CoA carboxylase biotin carboxyl carrier protein [Planctomycetota bacterium]|nr:MAG: acetyl-CoA carboxylase biotin carboxyl carrier protein [Planctomycetota bacterium]
MDIEKIRELVDMMVEHDLLELSVRDGDIEVNLRRPGTTGNGAVPVVHASSNASAPPAQAEAGSPPPTDEPEVEFLEITSPMVGTFYAAPDPESPPYVQPGSRVHPDTVVCIVEAMKVFNEIKAELSGTIEKVLVENEQAVEYGQPLFLVRPA